MKNQVQKTVLLLTVTTLCIKFPKLADYIISGGLYFKKKKKKTKNFLFCIGI